MVLIREATHSSVLNAANGSHPLTVAQTKNVIKLALHAIRIIVHVDPSSLDQVWDKKDWSTVITSVKASQTLAKDAGLGALLSQVSAKLGEGKEKERDTLLEGKKRKADGNDSEKSRKKIKRHKKPNGT